jgi:adenylyl- and sulfurtransferase ThiI
VLKPLVTKSKQSAKRKSQKFHIKKQSTTTNLSTAVNTNKHTKAKTTHSEAHNKEIQSEIQQKNQTENIGTDDNNGKRIGKKPEFYQAGVNRK